MVIISSQPTYSSGRAQDYAKKDAVAIWALHAAAPLFEKQLQQIRVRHGKDGMRPRTLTDSDGTLVRDASGTPVPVRDANGREFSESKDVQACCLIQSFSRDELDPDDPESWTKAQELGRALAEDRFPGSSGSHRDGDQRPLWLCAQLHHRRRGAPGDGQEYRQQRRHA